MPAYYNEIDPYAAQWLRNLIAAGHIAPGDVDERSITDVRPDDLRGYEQCHFFAGIGGWSLALRLAGWPDARPVWTGSCPCQPFSAAGKQRGSDDERHLWPAFFGLIRECRPGRVFGEQVAGAAGYAWFDHVAADLEGEAYAAAAVDIGAHSVGAFHLRQRLYWVADSDGWNSSTEGLQRSGEHGQQPAHRGAGSLADSRSIGWKRGANTSGPAAQGSGQWCEGVCDAQPRGLDGLLGNTDNAGLEIERRFPRIPCSASGAVAGEATERAGAPACRMGDTDSEREGARRGVSGRSAVECAGSLDAWRDIEWIACSDGKARPTQPGLFPLAHGIPNRVGRLRAYGNAIVPQVAAVFVMANAKVSGAGTASAGLPG